jgi:hypothetical protein
MKLTKKQIEIVDQIKQLENENNCTIYFRYLHSTNKIHPIKLNSVNEKEMNVFVFPYICTHAVATTMEKKGMIIPEVINNDLTLLKLNHEILV